MNHILNPQYNATLIYEYGDFKRVISCKVDNAPVFLRKPIFEEFTIQLLCLNPFWREEQETREDIAAWIGGMEFPIREEDDQPDGLEIPIDGTWEIGYRQLSLIVNVINGGDVKSGIRIDFRALGVLTNPSLLNVNTGEFIKLNISMIAGDVLSISTGYGEKAVTLRRNGVTTDAFRYLDVDSSYMQLSVGDNIFRYAADTAMENLEVCVCQVKSTALVNGKIQHPINTEYDNFSLSTKFNQWIPTMKVPAGTFIVGRGGGMGGNAERLMVN